MIELRSGDNAVNGGACGRVFMFFTSVCCIYYRMVDKHKKPWWLLSASPYEGTEKVPFFYDQNGKCLRFVTSLSANRLK